MREMLEFDCPVAGHEGAIKIAATLSAKEFLEWDKRTEELRGSDLPVAFQQFQARHHLIDFSRLKGLSESEKADKTGASLPAAALVYWAVEVTEPVILAAMNIKK